MNVSGIRPYAGFYEYNSIKLNELRNQQISEAQKLQGMSADMQESEEALSNTDHNELEAQQQEARSRQTYNAYDYAQEFKPGETYELKGEESDINSLDVEKAISDLEIDQVIQQYQFFVGDSANVIAQESAAAALKVGENFSL